MRQAVPVLAPLLGADREKTRAVFAQIGRALRAVLPAELHDSADRDTDDARARVEAEADSAGKARATRAIRRTAEDERADALTDHEAALARGDADAAARAERRVVAAAKLVARAGGADPAAVARVAADTAEDLAQRRAQYAQMRRPSAELERLAADATAPPRDRDAARTILTIRRDDPARAGEAEIERKIDALDRAGAFATDADRHAARLKLRQEAQQARQMPGPPRLYTNAEIAELKAHYAQLPDAESRAAFIADHAIRAGALAPKAEAELHERLAEPSTARVQTVQHGTASPPASQGDSADGDTPPQNKDEPAGPEKKGGDEDDRERESAAAKAPRPLDRHYDAIVGADRAKAAEAGVDLDEWLRRIVVELQEIGKFPPQERDGRRQTLLSEIDARFADLPDLRRRLLDGIYAGTRANSLQGGDAAVAFFRAAFGAHPAVELDREYRRQLDAIPRRSGLDGLSPDEERAVAIANAARIKQYGISVYALSEHVRTEDANKADSVVRAWLAGDPTIHQWARTEPGALPSFNSLEEARDYLHGRLTGTAANIDNAVLEIGELVGIGSPRPGIPSWRRAKSPAAYVLAGGITAGDIVQLGRTTTGGDVGTVILPVIGPVVRGAALVQDRQIADMLFDIGMLDATSHRAIREGIGGEQTTNAVALALRIVFGGAGSALPRLMLTAEGRSIVREIHAAATRAQAKLRADKSAGTIFANEGAQGTRMHQYFEQEMIRLRDLLKERGSRYSSEVELFLDRATAEVAKRRQKGSLGLDVVISFDGKRWRAFDLKSGNGWSKTALEIRERLFGTKIEQIFRPR